MFEFASESPLGPRQVADGCFGPPDCDVRILGQEGLNWAQVVHVGVSGQRLPFRLQAADTQEEILVGSCGGELTDSF